MKDCVRVLKVRMQGLLRGLLVLVLVLAAM